MNDASRISGDGGGGGGGDGAGGGDSGPTCADLAGSSHKALGGGTRSSPHLLCTPAQLLELMNTATVADWSLHYALGQDISLSGYDQASTPATRPIGDSTNPFRGSLNGRGFQISNFTYDGTGTDEIGFFGRTADAVIRNLRVTNATVTGRDSVGVVVGTAREGTLISNVHSSGTVTGTGTANGLGGIAGTSEGGGAVLSGVSSSATVHNGLNGGYHGGIVGHLLNGSVINNCFSSGTVRGFRDLGGVVGLSGGLVTNCYSTATVLGATGNVEVGGLVGSMTTYAGARLRRSFFAGSVDADDNVGTKVGPVVGAVADAASQTSHNYAVTGSCTDATGGCNSTALVGDGPVADFHGSTHAVYTVSGGEWKFPGAWTANAGGLPTLSIVEFDASSWGTCASHGADTPFAGGYGTLAFPYLLCTPTQFLALASASVQTTYQQGYVYRVMQNMDFNAVSLADLPIGADTTQGFSGVIDGAGHVFSNMNFGVTAVPTALINYMLGGKIMRLGVSGIQINATGQMAAALVVRFFGGGMSDVYVAGGSVTSAGAGVSGLAANLGSGSSLARSYSTTSADGWSGGGLLWEVHANIVGCFFDGSINLGGSGGSVTHNDSGASYYADAYFAQGSCTAGIACNAKGVGVDTGATPNYFYDASSPVFDTWDFNEVWQENTGAHPTLREGVVF